MEDLRRKCKGLKKDIIKIQNQKSSIDKGNTRKFMNKKMDLKKAKIRKILIKKKKRISEKEISGKS